MRCRRWRITVPCLVIALAAAAAPTEVLAQRDDPQHVAPTDPLPPSEQIKQFRLPPGFEIQLVAAEPDIRKPINLNFDARGRLWVTQSVEYPFPAKDPAKARDRVEPARRLRRRRPGTQGHDLRRRAEHPHRRHAAARRGHRLQHPEPLPLPRHRRRRQGRRPRGALSRVRLRRHPRHGQQPHPLDRRLGLRLPRLLQHLDGEGGRRPADHHAVGQHLPLSRRTARTSSTSRTGRSTRSA